MDQRPSRIDDPGAPLTAVRRVIRPGQPAFWFVLVFNAMTALLLWVSSSLELNVGLRLLVALFALGNALLGWHFLRQLWREGNAATAEPDADSRRG